MRIAAVAVSLGVVGCGGCDNETLTPDGPVKMDDRVCGTVSSEMVDIISYSAGDNPFASWGAPVMGDLGDGNRLVYQFEFYGGIEPSLAGTFDLHSGNQSNYKTCAICVRAFAISSTNQVVKRFFQSAGSITLTEDPFTNRHMIASLTNLQLEEVTIDPSTFTSSPVANGSCMSFADYMIDHDGVPNAWTCGSTEFNDGGTCNCVCGLSDPDCFLLNAPVAGCTNNDACFNDACVTRPANDTCQTAATVTVGTPVTATTLGGERNYNTGLEGQGCTSFPQPGSDVAYSVMLTSGTAYAFTLSGMPATFDGSIALLGPGAATLCDANPIVSCVAGKDDGLEGANETFTYTPTVSGTYFIIIDSYYTDEAGAFTLSVTAI